MGEFVRLEVEDGVGTIRLDRPKMNALNVAGAGGDPGRRPRGDRARRRPAVVVYGGERVFAAGADIKEMADMSYTDMVEALRRPAVGVHRGRADPQAGRRRGHRLRARRRLRARAVRRRPDRRRRRHARPARDPARHHPRRGRHPAADPAGRAEQGQGPDLHRAGSSRPTRRWRSGWSTRLVPAAEVYAEALAWARQFTGGRGVRAAGGQGARSTAGSRSTSTPAWRSSASSSRRCSPPRTARSACDRSSRTAPARPTSPVA